ncbi:hypothetical protein FC92_GL001081 [Liquorilactobacillus hordei DSM 19519]|uniref:Uncharacterized protein n=2 Tax=Liquorilactobacillus hordei TaxID=468911 RepID=A0A0R1MKJ5_9LACO|nr:hypothetical protein FC92_GL001081 [Liquorilactobacillus hordei DSM 19519]
MGDFSAFKTDDENKAKLEKTLHDVEYKNETRISLFWGLILYSVTLFIVGLRVNSIIGILLCLLIFGVECAEYFYRISKLTILETKEKVIEYAISEYRNIVFITVELIELAVFIYLFIVLLSNL